MYSSIQFWRIRCAHAFRQICKYHYYHIVIIIITITLIAPIAHPSRPCPIVCRNSVSRDGFCHLYIYTNKTRLLSSAHPSTPVHVHYSSQLSSTHRQMDMAKQYPCVYLYCVWNEEPSKRYLSYQRHRTRKDEPRNWCISSASRTIPFRWRQANMSLLLHIPARASCLAVDRDLVATQGNGHQRGGTSLARCDAPLVIAKFFNVGRSDVAPVDVCVCVCGPSGRHSHRASHVVFSSLSHDRINGLAQLSLRG